MKKTRDVKIVDLDILKNREQLFSLFGKHDENLRYLEEIFEVKIFAQGYQIHIEGAHESQDRTAKILSDIAHQMNRGDVLNPQQVRYMMEIMSKTTDDNLTEMMNDFVKVDSKKGFIRPKTLGQRNYIHAIRDNDITFSIGPAGTGKTYLAMSVAVESLLKRRVDRIVLARPAVEAGEKLGFLPGDLVEKVNPYLRPLYDALYDMMSFEKIQTLLSRGVIEIAPLAFMRGRTLNNSFVILDEAQNSTIEQMKMFLTRLGFDSKAVITGDITQVDIPEGRTRSGLVLIQKILGGIKGIEFVYLKKNDVVRHPLVQEIINAFEKSGDDR
ncbi:MAG: PhoH family protein [bacterium]|nr:PhoH family protein [bacterium]